MMDTYIKFADINAECDHWKSEAHKYYKENTNTQKELDEFQESSQQLEAELEASLEQKVNQCRDLLSNVRQLQLEADTLSQRNFGCQKDYATLENRCSAVIAELDQLKKYTRKLEQINDNLERDLRIVNESLRSMEAKLNEVLEVNILLKHELEDEEQQHETLQRLKDEIRDLKVELNVCKKSVSKSNVDGKLSSTQTSRRPVDMPEPEIIVRSEKLAKIPVVDQITPEEMNRIQEECDQWKTKARHCLEQHIGKELNARRESAVSLDVSLKNEYEKTARLNIELNEQRRLYINQQDIMQLQKERIHDLTKELKVQQMAAESNKPSDTAMPANAEHQSTNNLVEDLLTKLLMIETHFRSLKAVPLL